MNMCRNAPEEHQRELAFMINSLLRSDDADAAPHLAVIVRAVNTLLITRREDVHMVKFPPNGITYRGGGLPDAHRGFFTAGKKYRVPGFLATSFSRNVAEKFMRWADMREEPCVLWIVHVDPDGEYSEARKCMHVNFVERSNVEGEDEYLFAPYAPFTVRQASQNVSHACMHASTLNTPCMPLPACASQSIHALHMVSIHALHMVHTCTHTSIRLSEYHAFTRM
jgi:hypothetical protein